MAAPLFLAVYSNGDIWACNSALDITNLKGRTEAGTLVTCLRLNPDLQCQKITTLTGSGNASASALAATGGTGSTASKFTQTELT